MDHGGGSPAKEEEDGASSYRGNGDDMIKNTARAMKGRRARRVSDQTAEKHAANMRHWDLYIILLWDRGCLVVLGA